MRHLNICSLWFKGVKQLLSEGRRHSSKVTLAHRGEKKKKKKREIFLKNKTGVFKNGLSITKQTNVTHSRNTKLFQVFPWPESQRFQPRISSSAGKNVKSALDGSATSGLSQVYTLK